jgi:hypothetical protein
LKVFLLTLAALLLAGFCYLSKLVERYCKSNKEVVRLVIMMKDQEPWVEGFVRKLLRLSRGVSCLKILIIDDGSSDQTWEVLARLQRAYPFDLEGGTVVSGSPAGGHLFDARGLTGNDLLNSLVFSQLKALCAGKSPGLSK